MLVASVGAVRAGRRRMAAYGNSPWFTRVSLQNPVFATAVMLALVVLGTFSPAPEQVDQFPNVDFPVVVVVTDPGAAPEIVKSEISNQDRGKR